MKYKVGDKVRVRKDLVIDKVYGKDTFVSQMQKYSGKTMIIDSIKDNKYYTFKGDSHKWYWTDEMLEDAESISIIVKGNKVIAKRDGRVGIARCSPEDEFDVFIGAKLALDRLEEECKPYSWLKEGVNYYFPCVDMDDLYDCWTYNNNPLDIRIKERGIAFKTKEEAIDCAKKMLEVVK